MRLLFIKICIFVMSFGRRGLAEETLKAILNKLSVDKSSHIDPKTAQHIIRLIQRGK